MEKIKMSKLINLSQFLKNDDYSLQGIWVELDNFYV